MAFHPFRDWWLKMFAVALAVALWMSVSGEPIVERGLEVPLEFENVPPGLDVVGDTPGSVSVRVRGPASAVARMDPGSVVARLDLSGEVLGRKLYDMFADRIEVPSGIEVTSVVPATVSLVLERAGLARTVPIVPDLEGQPGEGFAVGRIATVPSSVQVTGPETRLSELREALTAPVSIAGATTDVAADVTVGVDDPTLRIARPLTAHVTVELRRAPAVRTIEDVPVAAHGSAAAIHARIEPTRIAVTIRGPRDAIGRLSVDSIEAHVDVGVLAELPPGRYNLPVSVRSPDPFRVAQIDPSSVQVGLQ